MLWFLTLRGLAVIFAAFIYFYCATQQASFLRLVQRGARWVVDQLETQLSDEWAVWLPTINLETSLTFGVFIVTGYMVVEILDKFFKYVTAGETRGTNIA